MENQRSQFAVTDVALDHGRDGADHALYLREWILQEDLRMTKDLVEKGYRWITVNGPYACVTEQELGKITSNRTDLAELHMVEEGRVYYLIPGTLVRVTRDDEANGMSVILLGGITKSLWTYTKFLSAHPIRDIYGIVETPDTAGLIDPGDAAIAAGALNERRSGEAP